MIELVYFCFCWMMKWEWLKSLRIWSSKLRVVLEGDELESWCSSESVVIEDFGEIEKPT